MSLRISKSFYCWLNKVKFVAFIGFLFGFFVLFVVVFYYCYLGIFRLFNRVVLGVLAFGFIVKKVSFIIRKYWV